MKFAEFNQAVIKARKELQTFQGDSNFPGLTPYDRIYAMPTNYTCTACLAIVRAANQWESVADTGMPVVEVFIDPGRIGGLIEVDKHSKLTSEQLQALAKIKQDVLAWVNNVTENLPPSTSTWWERINEK